MEVEGASITQQRDQGSEEAPTPSWKDPGAQHQRSLYLALLCSSLSGAISLPLPATASSPDSGDGALLGDCWGWGVGVLMAGSRQRGQKRGD